MTTRPSFPSLLNPWWEEAASLMSSLLLSKGNWEISSGGTCNPYLLERKFQGWKGGIAYPHPTPEGSLCKFGNANPHAQRAFPPMSPGGTPVT